MRGGQGADGVAAGADDARIIIGGKVFGWFTPTEAACIAVLYAVLLSAVVYREMT